LEDDLDRDVDAEGVLQFSAIGQPGRLALPRSPNHRTLGIRRKNKPGPFWRAARVN
jgi:hypothetical protein